MAKLDEAKKALDALHAKGMSGKTPATVHEEGMNQYEAAKEIRVLIRKIEVQPTGSLHLAIASLEQLLSKPQSKRVDRLAKLNEVKSALTLHQTQSTASMSRLKVLAQILPTAPNLPTSKAQNVLGAFVAILKSNGILNHDGTVNL